jgi:hypothetical protein
LFIIYDNNTNKKVRARSVAAPGPVVLLVADTTNCYLLAKVELCGKEGFPLAKKNYEEVLAVSLRSAP